jgi:hypothetical protein
MSKSGVAIALIVAVVIGLAAAGSKSGSSKYSAGDVIYISLPEEPGYFTVVNMSGGSYTLKEGYYPNVVGTGITIGIQELDNNYQSFLVDHVNI